MQGFDRRRHVRHTAHKIQAFSAGKATTHHVFEQRQQRAVIARDVDEDDGLLVHTQLGFGQNFEKLVQSAKAAGQQDEGIRDGKQAAFAALQVGGQLEALAMAHGALLLLQEFRQDAVDRLAEGAHGAGGFAHQPNIAATEHQ